MKKKTRKPKVQASALLHTLDSLIENKSFFAESALIKGLRVATRYNMTINEAEKGVKTFIALKMRSRQLHRGSNHMFKVPDCSRSKSP